MHGQVQCATSLPLEAFTTDPTTSALKVWSLPSSFCRIRFDMQLAAVYSPPMIANVCKPTVIRTSYEYTVENMMHKKSSCTLAEPKPSLLQAFHLPFPLCLII